MAIPSVATTGFTAPESGVAAIVAVVAKFKPPPSTLPVSTTEIKTVNVPAEAYTWLPEMLKTAEVELPPTSVANPVEVGEPSPQLIVAVKSFAVAYGLLSVNRPTGTTESPWPEAPVTGMATGFTSAASDTENAEV